VSPNPSRSATFDPTDANVSINVNRVNMGCRRLSRRDKRTNKVANQLQTKKPALLSIVIALTTTAALTWFLYSSQPSSISSASTPLPVETTPYKKQPFYLRSAEFLGYIAAENDSLIGFEVSGTIIDLPANPGDRVDQGDVLAILDTKRREALLQARQAEVRRVAAELELARLQATRLDDLHDDGLASQQDFDEARFRAEALEATLASVEANAESSRLDIERSRLRAPFAGVVANQLVETGAVVTPSMPVLHLVSEGALEAHVGVPQSIVPTLNVGQPYELHTKNRRIDARLRAIRQDIDPATLTVGAIFDPIDDLDLLDGQTVTLKLEERVEADGGWLPLDALTEGSRGLWSVLVVNAEVEGHIARRESVEVLYSRDNRVFVRGTLPDSALVISGGLQRLSPGTIVDPLGR